LRIFWTLARSRHAAERDAPAAAGGAAAAAASAQFDRCVPDALRRTAGDEDGERTFREALARARSVCYVRNGFVEAAAPPPPLPPPLPPPPPLSAAGGAQDTEDTEEAAFLAAAREALGMGGMGGMGAAAVAGDDRDGRAEGSGGGGGEGAAAAAAAAASAAAAAAVAAAAAAAAGAAGDVLELARAEVADAAEARALLLGASAVVGMHPDLATEPIVDFARAHRKPFAVVPCCVFAQAHQWRRLKATGAVPRSYDDFVAYLVEKDPEHIRVAELAFGGRNKVVYATSWA